MWAYLPLWSVSACWCLTIGSLADKHFHLKCWRGPVGTAQWVKCLLHVHEDLNLDYQYSFKSQAWLFILWRQRQENPLASKARSQRSRYCEKPASKKKPKSKTKQTTNQKKIKWSLIKEGTQCYLWPLHVHTYTNVCTHWYVLTGTHVHIHIIVLYTWICIVEVISSEPIDL